MDDAIERVWADPQLRIVLATARSWGISPRRFLGWEPKRDTVLLRSEVGEVVRQIETREVEWDEESRDLAVAFMLWEADKCPGCGHPLAETTAAQNEGKYKVPPAIRCHYCTAIEQTAPIYEESPQRSALMLHAELKPQEPPHESAHAASDPDPALDIQGTDG